MRSSIYKLIGVILALTVPLAGALAEDQELVAEKSEKVDAVLLLDGSGSMLRTDPRKLREEGAKLFVQFLKPGDRLGIIEFSSTARVIRSMSPYETDQESSVKAEISKVSSAGEYTDIMAGIEAAKRMMEESRRGDVAQVIILLSDGKMEPNPAIGSATAHTARLMETVLPELKEKEIKIYALSFSDLADRELLAQIAAATDSLSMFTPEAEKIHEMFADLFLAVKKPQMVPLTSKGFSIDEEITEATFYVNRENVAEVTIEDPDGETITAAQKPENVKWFRGQKFDVITVTLPKPGDWQLIGLAPQDGFATVLTNLKLVTEWPSSSNAGDDLLLQAQLYDSSKPVELPEMSDVVRFGFQIIPTDRVSEPIVRELLSDDGTNGDKIARDGIFSAKVRLEEPGEYKLSVIARAPTFDRSQQLPFHVKPRLITLRVGKNEADGDSGHGGSHGHGAASGHDTAHGHSDVVAGSPDDVFLVELSQEAANMKKPEVKLLAVDGERKRYVLPLKDAGHGHGVYQVSSRSLPQDGTYTLHATFSAQAGVKRKIHAETDKLKYVRSSSGAAVGEAEEIAEVTTEEPSETAILDKLPVEEPSLTIYIVMITIFNVLSAAGVLLFLRRTQKTAALSIPVFASIAELQSDLEQLKAIAVMSEVDPEAILASGPPDEQQGPVSAESPTAPAAEPPAAAPSEPSEAPDSPSEAASEEAPSEEGPADEEEDAERMSTEG